MNSSTRLKTILQSGQLSKLIHSNRDVNMRGSRKFCQRGSNFDVFLLLFCFVFFSLGRAERIQIPLLANDGPPAKRHYMSLVDAEDKVSCCSKTQHNASSHLMSNTLPSKSMYSSAYGSAVA